MAAGALVGVQALTQVLAGVSANNQAKKNADILEDLGIVAAEDTRREVRSLLGAQRAAQAANAGDPNTGSNLDIAAESASEGELAALRAQFGFESQANVAENEGRAALVSSIIGAGGTILGGTATALGQNPSTSTPGNRLRLKPGVDFRPGAAGQPF